MEEHKERKHVTEHKPVNHPPRKKSSGTRGLMTLMAVLIGVTLLLGVVNLFAIYSLHGKIEGTTGAAVAPLVIPEPTPTAPEPLAPPTPVDVSADDDAVKGDEDAPVEIIEFSDFECPFCSRFYVQTYPMIKENYIDTGKVKFIHRDFPLGFHANAQKASEAAECAKDQDLYWEMYEALYTATDLTLPSLKQMAADAGVDTETFDTCLDSGEKAAEIAKDMSDGQAAGVSGTPSFFINGVKLVGAQPFSAFQQIIDAELA